MSTAANIALVQRLYTEAINGHDLAAFDQLHPADYLDHNASPGQAPGLDGLKQAFYVFFTAFPDLRFTVEDQIAGGDRVASRLTVDGTHLGDFMGVPATGRAIHLTGLEIARIEDGQIVERWGLIDSLTMLQQLGLMPQPN